MPRLASTIVLPAAPVRQRFVDLSAVPQGRAFSLHFYDDTGVVAGTAWTWRAELWAEEDYAGDGPCAEGSGDTAEAALAEAMAAEQRGEVA